MDFIIIFLCWLACAITSTLISFRLGGYSIREITVYEIALFLFFAPFCFLVDIYFLLLILINRIINLDYQPLRPSKTKAKQI
jgi:hypothetical protein